MGGCCLGKLHGELGLPLDLLEDSWMRELQWLMDGLLDGVHDVINSIHVPLMLSESPVSHFLSCFPLSSSQMSTLDGSR